jgi:hypothetical protein
MALTPDNISSARDLLNTKSNDVTAAGKAASVSSKSSTNNVNTFNNTVNSANLSSNFATDLAQNVTSAINDPFNEVIQKALAKINTLIPAIEQKIDKLEQDIVKKADNKGRVTLQNNTIVITVTRADSAEAQAMVARITSQITSIQKSIVLLKTVIDTLNAIVTAIQVFLTVLAIQEVALSINPASKVIFTVMKKALKVIFLKEIIKGYASLMAAQLKSNQKVLQQLTEKFTSLHVSVVITDEAEKGNFISQDDAKSMIATNLLGENIVNDNSDFTSNNNIQYILKVEKYGSKEIIGRAYDKFSGMVGAETAPSYLSTPEDLKNELKTILNLGT